MGMDEHGIEHDPKANCGLAVFVILGCLIGIAPFIWAIFAMSSPENKAREANMTCAEKWPGNSVVSQIRRASCCKRSRNGCETQRTVPTPAN